MKRSTQVLLGISAAVSAAMGWLVDDPTHLQQVISLLHGHTAIIGVVLLIVQVWNVFHQPAKDGQKPPFANYKAPMWLLAVFLIPAMLLTSGCSSWEQTTYRTLAASKAVIDQADIDYRSAAIPQTQADAELINEARSVQIAAVESFKEYALAKVAKNGNLAQKEAAVNEAVAKLPQLLASIKAVYGGGH